MLAALVLAGFYTLSGVEDILVAHPGDLEIPRLRSTLDPSEPSGMAWHIVILGGDSGYGEMDPHAYPEAGAEVAWGEAERARVSLFGGIVSGDFATWLAGASVSTRRPLGEQTTLQFRGSYTYQARFVDSGPDVFFTVPIPGTETAPPTEAEMVLEDVTWNRVRMDASLAQMLSRWGETRAGLVLESGLHFVQDRFEGVNGENLFLGESEETWMVPISAFLVLRSPHFGMALGIRSDVEFKSRHALAGVIVTF